MDDGVNELFPFLVWPLPETAMGLLRNCHVGPLTYTWYTLRDTTIPLVRTTGFPRTKMIELDRPPW